MDSIFMNSRIVKHPHRLLLNFLDKTSLKQLINMLPYQFLAFTIHEKIFKKSRKDNKI